MNSTSSPFERWVVRSCENVFPLQVVLGVTGNVLNLSVLLCRGMRRRSNTLLAMAAISDILFLLALIPNNLSRKTRWVYAEECDSKPCYTSFGLFYISNKQHFTFLANSFSASGSWFLVAVSFDRLWAIKSPFPASTRSAFCPMRQVILILFVFFSNAILAFHHNFAVVPPSESSSSLSWARVNSFVALINMISQSILPLLLLIFLNFFLLYYLRLRRHLFAPSSRECTSTRSTEDDLPPLVDIPSAPFPAPRNWGRQLARTERHITITVVAILSMYVLTHLPSAFVYANMYLFHVHDKYRMQSMYTWVALSTFIVVTGKVANFFLFCLSSKHFRRQLIKQVYRMLGGHAISIRDSNHLPPTRSLPLNTIDHSPRVSP